MYYRIRYSGFELNLNTIDLQNALLHNYDIDEFTLIENSDNHVLTSSSSKFALLL